MRFLWLVPALGALYVVGAPAPVQAGKHDILYVPAPAGELRPRVTTAKSPRGLAQKRTIFLNRQGGTYKGGLDNDSSINQSSLVIGGPYVIAPASYDDGEWATIMSCVREMYAPFAMEITDIEPAEGDYIEVVFPKDSSDIGHELNAWGGVAFDIPCENEIEADGIVYSVDYWAPVVACSVVAQESGHMLGLEHSADCSDPLSYGYVQPTCFPHAFRDNATQCVGNDGTADTNCRCNGSTQNTYQILLDRLGPSESEPPVVAFTAPAEGATVPVGSEVTATATDNIGVTKVELLVDDVFHVADTAGPNYRLPLSRALAAGIHTLRLRAYDNAGNIGEAVAPRTITVEAECATDDECPDGSSCNGIACVGDLGSTCSEDSACGTGLCADVGQADKICTQLCSGPGAVACPSGSTCESAGAGLDKCLPASGGGPCGCRAGGAGGGWAGLGGLSFGVILAGLLARGRRGKDLRSTR